MNMIENEVFTKVRSAVITAHGNDIYITSEYTPKPPKFPCVYLYEADNFNAGFDSDNTEVITGVTYTVEVYSNKQNGKKSEAKSIMSTVDTTMTKLGFTRTMMQQIPNLSDATIFRLTARYTASVIDNVIYRR